MRCREQWRLWTLQLDAHKRHEWKGRSSSHDRTATARTGPSDAVAAPRSTSSDSSPQRTHSSS